MSTSYVIQMTEDDRMVAERVTSRDWSELLSIEHTGCLYSEDDDDCLSDIAACRAACEADAGQTLDWERPTDDGVHVIAFAGPI